MRHFLFALLFGATVASAATVFNENDNVVVFEAEDYSNSVSRTGHTWTFTNQVAGYSGTGYMQALPDDNTAVTLATSPELQFPVNFNSSGMRVVWVRGYATDINGDSVHAGIDGTGATATNIAGFTPLNAWVWTNVTTFGNVATINVASPGLHTINLWMREDGMRVDKVVLTTNAAILPYPGNVWHIPINDEGDLVNASIPAMRNPLTAIFSNTVVSFYTGNQFAGAGNIGNQLTTGSTLFYKHATNSTWSSRPMLFFKIGTANVQNKYYSNSIPANVFSAGDSVQYYFKVPYSDHVPTYVYGNDAQSFTTELESVAQANPFSFQVRAYPRSDYTPSPSDWRDQNIYQIFTDRFFDGDPGNNLANPDSFYDLNAAESLHGGDFRGIQQKLGYLRSLGVTALWISPILRNPLGQYHGYGTMDFYQIDPHWGTYTDLTNMIAAAHAHGILVTVDVICNHPSDLIYSTDAAFTNTFRAPPNGYNLQYRDPGRQYPPPFNTNALNPTLASLFHTNGWIVNFNDQQQVELGELRDLDDFRTETAYVRTNMANIWQHWIGQADFDGFRVDTVKHVEHGLWQFWAPQIHQYATALGKSNFFMYGETLSGDEGLVGIYTGTQAGGNFELDSMHDYALWFKVNSVFAQASGNTKQIEDHYNNLAANYDPVARDRLATFLDNHDQPRFLSINGATTNRLAVALTFLYSSRGVPTLYYGTEQAFNGGTRPADREDMFAGGWEFGPSLGDNFNMTHPLYRHIAKLNNFRRNYPSLRRGTHVNRWNDPDSAGLFAYARVLGGEETFVVFNTAGTSQTIASRPTSYSSGTVLVNLFDTNDTLTVTGTPEIPSFSVPATSFKIFVAQSLLKPLDPVVVSQSPAHAATNVSPAASIVLQFSKPMDTNSVQAAFSLTPATPGQFSWSGQTAMTFTANALLPVLTTNSVRISTNAMDAISSNKFFGPFETWFVTAPTTGSDVNPPSVAIDLPLNGSTFTGMLNASGTASDAIGVARVEVRIDAGTWIAVEGTTNWSAAFDTAGFLNGSHTLSARAIDTSGNTSATDSCTVKFLNIPTAYLQRVSAGSFQDVTNCNSLVWSKDRAYTLGTYGYVGGFPGYIAGNAISNICFAGEPLYQRERYSATNSTFRYFFDVPEGVYETTLLESETKTNSPNGRVFNVFIEGQQVLTNLDLFVTSGGMNKPYSRTFTNVVGDSQLEIYFVPVKDAARASGIQVRRIGEIDTDVDGIPDWWMRGYFDHPTGQAGDQSLPGDDADGDGFTTMQEFLAGTDPGSAASALRITQIERVGNDMQVSWQSAANKTNQLQRSTAPDISGSWTDVGLTTPGTGGILSQPDSGAATNAAPLFYRVKLIP